MNKKQQKAKTGKRTGRRTGRPQSNETKAHPKRLRSEFDRVRLGFAIGAAAIIAATAFMNISGWVSMAGTISQALANGVMSGGMELISISSIALAGHQASKGRWGRALALLAAGSAVIYFNTLATQNFIHVQGDAQLNEIEMDGAELGTVQAQIDAIDRELQSIINQNGGVPRDLETIEQAYANLDPDKNPINMMRRDAEMGARLRYEALMAERLELVQGSESAQVGSNDQVRTVIPGTQLGHFIWTMEVLKAGASFMLGSGKVIAPWDEKGKAKKANARKWAVIKRNSKKADYSDLVLAE